MNIKLRQRALGTLLLCASLLASAAAPIGARAAVPGVAVQKYITVDQFGYRPNDDKVAVLVDPQQGFNASDAYVPGSVLEVRRASDDAVVFTGAPTVWNGGATQANSGDRGWWFDFSSVTAEGDYYVYDAENNMKSYDFEIAEDVYNDALKAAVRTFYYQRIGTPHLAEHAGAAFADGPALIHPRQDSEARNVFDRNNPETERDLSGGWMDAGDFNKYVTFTAQPVNELLSAYELNPDAFGDDYNIPESGNGVPDILDEVKWELDWLMKMQEDDGGVLLKVGFPREGRIGEFSARPSEITMVRYYLPKASSSTIVTALNFAHAAIVFDQIPSMRVYAAELRQRAIMAWDWYHSNPKTENADNYELEAGDADMPISGQAQVAAVASAYLYALTGDETYHDYFKSQYRITQPMIDGYWGLSYGEQADGVMFYTTLPNADPAVKAHILERRDVQDFEHRFEPNRDLFRSSVPDWSYHWGSLQVRARLASSAYDFVQYDINPAKREEYDLRARNILHYFHGVNPFGRVYLTNMSEYGAEHSITQIFHAWFFDGTQWDIAPPGFLPGGPSEQYEGTMSPPRGQPRQKMYLDWNGVRWGEENHYDRSWEITENAIYYQGGYVKMVAKYAAPVLAPKAPPETPTGAAAAAMSESALAFAWSHSPGATGYEVEVDGFVVDNGLQRRYVENGLEPQTAHTFRVRAKNAYGVSAWSEPATGVTEAPPTPPATPARLTAAAVGSFQANITWSPSEGTRFYELEVDGETLNLGLATKYTHKKLQAESTHTYRVRARNAGGVSEWSAPVVLTLPEAPPNHVIDVSHDGVFGYTFGEFSDQLRRYQTFVSEGYPVVTGIDLKLRKLWGEPGDVTVQLYATSDNRPTGEPLAETILPNEAVQWNDWTEVSVPIAYEGLVSGAEYAVVLGQTSPEESDGVYEWLAGYDVESNWNFGKNTRAAGYVDESSIGDGWMRVHVATGTQQPPATPTGLAASAAGDASIAVAWNAAAGATAYEVEADGGTPATVTGTTYSHGGLASGTAHTYRVRAVNAVGASAWSEPVSASTSEAQPAVDVIDLSHVGNGAFTFGEARDQLLRYQTFAANAHPSISKVEVKVRRWFDASDMTVSLYATQNDKPVGEPLATATVAATAIPEAFAIIGAPLTYTGLKSGMTYAIVLGQVEPSDFTYEWQTADVGAALKFGKFSDGEWIDESRIGDGWLKVYVGQ
ncbi:glycoside hydrolase family 9 protein [Paenibacillus sp.]|uniref:glycoside hydrolase family 9 protein n=1 Tax=Paenibacillus sp. TaxID=58172 RepID=UPI002810ED72|nr:glycoside hydrolase family 9 protein [Paenibacillus sp.]